MAGHPTTTRQKPEEITADTTGTDAVEQSPQPVAVASGRPTLAQRMALPEPARTKALEAASSNGEQFYLRAKGRDVKVSYGGTILTIGKEPRGFSAAHAIHVLWKRGELIEEVAE